MSQDGEHVIASKSNPTSAGRLPPLSRVILSILALAALIYGWRLFWFLTDDAYIAFRYVSNSLLGHGYVWNPPPFRPVEGYTSFLWVALLDVIWRVFRIPPPSAANVVSLLFASGSLLLGIAFLYKLKLPDRFRPPHRFVLFALVMTGVIANRTFLAWSSSGLETAMFNFFLTLWLYSALILPVGGRGRLFGISFASSMIYMTRPDGLLFVASTLLIIGLAMAGRTGSIPSFLKSGAGAWPLLAVPAHLLWRREFYGEWLPNTYFAKAIGGRDHLLSGLQYIGSFVLEYSLWVWIILLGLVAVRAVRNLRSHPPQAPPWIIAVGFTLIAVSGVTLLIRDHASLATGMLGFAVFGFLLIYLMKVTALKSVALLTIYGHIAYYTIHIGGDHFEYRVYSYLIPLAFLSFLWLLIRNGSGPRLTIAAMATFVVLSLPIPWLHWSASHNLSTHEETSFLKISMVETAERTLPVFPGILRSYLQVYDNWQFALIDRITCLRHQEHKVFHESQIARLPSRDEGSSIRSDSHPVLAGVSVGVASWVLPHVNIIDGLGLNDYVIARNPDLYPSGWMAHERRPPEGYIEGFRPNVIQEGRRFRIVERNRLLTASNIADHERKFASVVESRERDYTEAARWLRENTPASARIAHTGLAAGTNFKQRNVLEDTKGDLKDWRHILNYSLSANRPDYLIVSPYSYWRSVTETWWFGDLYRPLTDVGSLEIYERIMGGVGPEVVSIDAEFESGLHLHSATLTTASIDTAESVCVWLSFRLDHRLSSAYHFRVFLFNDSTGERHAPTDGWPFGDFNAFPTTVWPALKEIVMPVRIPIPSDLPSGDYRAGLQIFDTTLKRELPLTRPDGAGSSEVRFGEWRVGKANLLDE